MAPSSGATSLLRFQEAIFPQDWLQIGKKNLFFFLPIVSDDKAAINTAGGVRGDETVSKYLSLLWWRFPCRNVRMEMRV